MTPLAEGVRLSIIGLGLVFGALGVLILLLFALQRVSNYLLDIEERRAPPATIDRPVVPDGEQREQLRRVAVIAIAMAVRRTSAARDAALGDLLQRPSLGGWGLRGSFAEVCEGRWAAHRRSG